MAKALSLVNEDYTTSNGSKPHPISHTLGSHFGKMKCEIIVGKECGIQVLFETDTAKSHLTLDPHRSSILYRFQETKSSH